MSEWFKVSENNGTFSICISGQTVENVSKEEVLTAAMLILNSKNTTKAQQIANLVLHQRNSNRYSEAVDRLVALESE